MRFIVASTMPMLMQEDSTQPALVGVTSSVIEEYNPARPNDYEEYRRERKKRVMEVVVWWELEPSVKKKKNPQKPEPSERRRRSHLV